MLKQNDKICYYVKKKEVHFWILTSFQMGKYFKTLIMKFEHIKLICYLIVK